MVGGGVSASVHAEIHPPPGRHPPRQTPPPPGKHTPPHDGHCSGQYASYWNAFLFHRRLSVRGGGGSVRDRDPPWTEIPPPYGKERALRILLECILYLYFFKSTFTSELIIKLSIQNTSLINIYHP